MLTIGFFMQSLYENNYVLLWETVIYATFELQIKSLLINLQARYFINQY